MGFLNRLPARLDAYYDRNRMWGNAGSDTAANRRTLVSPSHMLVNIGGAGKAYELEAAVSLDLNSPSAWDGGSSTYATAANRAGMQFYYYACVPVSGFVPVILCSANSTYPTGYSATTSRRIGTFHCVCADVGNITNHPLTGYLAGDILPRSIQDIKHRPRSGFMPGMVWAGKTDFDSINEAPIWKAIYLASGTGVNTVSAFGATISDNRNWMDFVDDFADIGCRMLRDWEFQATAKGVPEGVNIQGSADPVTTGGHVATNGQRIISYIGSEDDVGVMWQWLDEQSYRYDLDGTVQAASQTATITYVSSLEGAPIYLKWNGPTPYLCANIVADTWITMGSYAIQIKSDSAPGTGGVQIYFRDAATNPLRLYAAVQSGKNAYIPSSNPDFNLPILYHATPSSQGVELRYDNVSHNRLEAINTSGQNQTIDLATSPGWSYYTLPGGKGSEYKQGSYGDVKLLAGSSWNGATNCGSRGRNASCYRWFATSAIGSRAAAEPA